MLMILALFGTTPLDFPLVPAISVADKGLKGRKNLLTKVY